MDAIDWGGSQRGVSRAQLRTTIVLLVLALAGLTLLMAPGAHAGALYVDATRGVNQPGCGRGSGRLACKTWAYWYDRGCDRSGCADSVTAGDTIHFGAGIYDERITIPFNGRPGSPVTVLCDAIGRCRLTGAAISGPSDCAVVCVGCGRPSNSACNSSRPARHVVFRGFSIEKFDHGAAIVGKNRSSYVWIDRNRIDPTGQTRSSNNLIQAGGSGARTANCSDWVISNNDIGPIVPGVGPSGGMWLQNMDRVWIVGNHFYFPGPTIDGVTNNDCFTLLGVQDYVVDGNTCEGGADGIDVGMQGDHNHPLFRGIIRANFVRGQGYGKNFKHSCQAETPITTCGQTSFYKNVNTFDAAGHFGRNFEVTENSHGVTLAQNTLMAGTASNNSTTGWVIAGFGRQFADTVEVYFKDNAIDGLTSATTPERMSVAETDATTQHACDTPNGCPFRNNRVWFEEAGADARLLQWSRGTGANPPRTWYTVGEFGTIFNTELPRFNTSNQRADPHWVGARSHAALSQLANLRLTSGATAYIDQAKGLCKADGRQVGVTTIRVRCPGTHSNDPRQHFPNPRNVWTDAVTDGLCAQTRHGTRSADGIGAWGCFTLQIQGVGVRRYLAESSTSISFAGAPMTVQDGAIIGIPWLGAAPDIGALEYDAGARP